jgi:hypothetical protein
MPRVTFDGGRSDLFSTALQGTVIPSREGTRDGNQAKMENEARIAGIANETGGLPVPQARRGRLPEDPRERRTGLRDSAPRLAPLARSSAAELRFGVRFAWPRPSSPDDR